jgi:hypothetical protein
MIDLQKEKTCLGEKTILEKVEGKVTNKDLMEDSPIGENFNSVVCQEFLYSACHSRLDQEPSLFNLIPAGVYPVLDTGQE